MSGQAPVLVSASCNPVMYVMLLLCESYDGRSTQCGRLDHHFLGFKLTMDVNPAVLK